MTDLDYNQLVTEISRDIVAQTVPQELPLYAAISDEYRKDPERTLKHRTEKDEDLAFGVADSAMLLTPIILEVVKEVLNFLAGEVAKVAREESTKVIGAGVKSLFKKYMPAETPDAQALVLTSEQLSQIHLLALEKARQLALSGDQAALLADSIVGSLSVTPL